MSLAIVAIPKQDDYVWNISSEKIPHMTILFLGDNASDTEIAHMTEFIEHATDLMIRPFGLDVDYRAELGPDKADVLFFRKEGRNYEDVNSFRGELLQDKTIRLAYESTDQFPEWTPHLTLGYPETPAKKDPRDYPGFSWVWFDKIAFWTGDFTGPEFRLKSPEVDYAMAMSFQQSGIDFLEHHGVKGQKWGVRRNRQQITRSADAQRHADNAKKHLSELSDKDLKDLHNRLNTERNVRQLQRGGKTFAQNLIEQQAKDTVRNVVKAATSAAAVSAGAALAIKLISTKEAVSTIAQF